VPCEVCVLTPQQISDILNFDNLPGDPVHPLHEAAGWQSLIDKDGWTVQMIADRIGKSIGYVYKRLLVAGMIEDAKTRVRRRGDHLRPRGTNRTRQDP